MKKIMILTGSRGEWGYIRPIMKMAQERDDVKVILVVTNMHLLEAFGSSYKEIEKDGLRFICLLTDIITIHMQNHLGFVLWDYRIYWIKKNQIGCY